MKQSLKRLSIILILLFVSLSCLFFFTPKPPLLKGLNFSRAVYDDQGHLLRLTLSHDDKYRLYTPLSAISQSLIDATLLQEDQYFYWHPGINPFALVKAGWQTYVVKSRRIGASTITMQLARMRYGMNSKTSSGKIWQIIRALQIELHYSKRQILEAYLNLAPYGNNIEGVGAASLVYFDKPAKQLGLADALTLSVIPQNPVQRSGQLKNLKLIRNKLFQRWLAHHPQDRNQQVMMDLPLQMQSVRRLPFSAPHFVNSVLDDAGAFSQSTLQTTLNSRLQSMLEKVTRRYLNGKKALGAYNASALVIDARDMSVKAMVGSANFFDLAIGGEINGTEIKRSPGSTLKPFIYALALDQGLIHPDTVLKDVPHSFGSYNPENFDYDFMGPIKAKDALVLSRNIPAIYLADQLRTPDLYQLLEQAEVSHLKPASYYGLALVLGGAELSMQELTSLYAMLINEGRWHTLRMRKDQPLSTGKQLLSPEASFLVLDMLKHTPRPDDAVSSIPWKTGTSSGYRDAWAVGVIGPYVLAVWVGNFNNQGNPAFVGRTMAGPLFFSLADVIKNEMHPPVANLSDPAQLKLTRIPVCKASGMLPTRYCHDTELTWFIPGKSPIKTDTIYREVAIDKRSGLRVCHPDQNTRFEIFEFWPSDLLKIFKRAGIARRTPPLFEKSCNVSNSKGFNPEITSPKNQLSYVIHPDLARDTLIPFTAIADADVGALDWFINENYLAKTRRDHAFVWHAKPGKYVVRVVDDHGRSDAVDVIVRVDVPGI